MFLSEVAKIKIEKENFEYLISSEIVVMGDYKNEDYYDRVKNKKDEIEMAWEKEQERRNKKLFNKNIINLAIIEQQTIDNRLILQCNTVEYKHYLVQRSGIDLGITPLAVSGIVFYQENNSKIFYVGKRSETVTQYPGYYEFIPSGSIDSKNIVPNQPVDYSNQLVIELKEELGVPVEDIKSHSTFCLIFDEIDRVYDIGIEIEVSNVDNVCKSNEEYINIQRISDVQLDRKLKKENTVITSKRLFSAFKKFHGGCL
jgi:hypothetical protein